MKTATRIITFGSFGILLLLLAILISMIQPQKEQVVKVGRLSISVDVADEPAEWSRGLVGHSPLGAGEGMFFIFPQEGSKKFWMKDMSFPIDIIWIHENEIVGYVDEAQPDKGETLYQSPGLVDRVLEVASGQRKELGMSIGDPVSLE